LTGFSPKLLWQFGQSGAALSMLSEQPLTMECVVNFYANLVASAHRKADFLCTFFRTDPENAIR
jgi:hypothetical protein